MRKTVILMSLVGLMFSPNLASAKKMDATPPKKQQAKVTKKTSPDKILSYYQWRELSKKDRAKYIRGLQVISHRWDLAQQSFNYSHNEAENMANKWAIFSELLVNKSVAADPENCTSFNFKYRPGEICTKDTFWFSKTHCSKTQELPVTYARQCPEKYKKFVEETRPQVREKNRARYDEVTALYLTPNTNPNAVAPPVGGDITTEAAEVPAPLESCESTGPGCEPVDDEGLIDERRQAYRKEMDEKFVAGQQPCVIAGFISTLNDRKKCTPKRSHNIGQWSGRCGSSETMCNPLVFGFGQDGKPVCVSLNMAVTAQCHEMTRTNGNSPEAIQEQISGNSNIAALQKITTEDFADAWQEQRSGMGKLCTEKTQSLAFFCKECVIMSVRIGIINKPASCADSCGRLPTDGPCNTATGPLRETEGTQ